MWAQECQNIKFVREAEVLSVSVEPGMTSGQVRRLIWHPPPLHTPNTRTCGSLLSAHVPGNGQGGH